MFPPCLGGALQLSQSHCQDGGGGPDTVDSWLGEADNRARGEQWKMVRPRSPSVYIISGWLAQFSSASTVLRSSPIRFMPLLPGVPPGHLAVGRLLSAKTPGARPNTSLDNRCRSQGRRHCGTGKKGTPSDQPSREESSPMPSTGWLVTDVAGLKSYSLRGGEVK